MAICNVSGYILDLDIQESVQSAIVGGIFERQETDWFHEILKPKMIFIDIGSHVGYFSFIASSIVGSEGCVYSIEPSDYCYNILDKNIKANNIQNIKSFQLGIGDKTEKREMYIQGNNIFAPSFVPSIETSLIKGIKIGQSEIITLDDFALQNNIKYIDFIKIDAEGYEPNILRGMKSLLENKNIKRIMIELNDDWLVNNNSSSNCLSKYLFSYGFILEKNSNLSETICNSVFKLKD